MAVQILSTTYKWFYYLFLSNGLDFRLVSRFRAQIFLSATDQSQIFPCIVNWT